tara:strand:+ start:18409 stop:19011 length:603 start_codon:yes stop_codon:yes gene_type:complete
MTPREYKEFEEKEKERLANLAADWHHPLSKGNHKLCTVLDSMKEFKLSQEDVPLIIKLTENPNYPTSKLFTGAVNLFSHDCIHVLLGRGLLPKDEAFVIGYTMGSGQKMSRWRRNLFLWVCKHLYPEGYKFNEEERYVFYSGVMAGSKCSVDLSNVPFEELINCKITDIRHTLGIDKSALKCYYCLEKSLFDDKESQRLL